MSVCNKALTLTSNTLERYLVCRCLCREASGRFIQPYGMLVNAMGSGETPFFSYLSAYGSFEEQDTTCGSFYQHGHQRNPGSVSTHNALLCHTCGYSQQRKHLSWLSSELIASSCPNRSDSPVQHRQLSFIISTPVIGSLNSPRFGNPPA